MFEAGKNFIGSQKKLKRFLKENQFDYYYVAHPLNALEFHFAKGIDNSVILTEHGGVDAYNRVYKKIKNWLYPKAKYYSVPTKTDTEVYRKMGFNTVYIPHFKSQLRYEKAALENKIALMLSLPIVTGKHVSQSRYILQNVSRTVIKSSFTHCSHTVTNHY